DVDGVFTADPRIVPDATKLDQVSYEEMLELSASGAKVLMLRAVEFGRRFDVPIHVRSSFQSRAGTWIRGTGMEQAIISGIAHDVSEARVTVRGVPDSPDAPAALFQPLAARGLSVDMIVQNLPTNGWSDISFTVPLEQVEAAREVTARAVRRLGAGGLHLDRGIARVSVVGAGMKSYPGVAALIFTTLAAKGIGIEMISTSSVRISCIVRADRVEEAVAGLHEALQPPTYQLKEVRT
ncbi:MAG: aspartate kinase, partial [Actinomycetota bacterium]|nr:aspartate kinase [Actinomycetota bacterium]